MKELKILKELVSLMKEEWIKGETIAIDKVLVDSLRYDKATEKTHIPELEKDAAKIQESGVFKEVYNLLDDIECSLSWIWNIQNELRVALIINVLYERLVPENKREKISLEKEPITVISDFMFNLVNYWSLKVLKFSKSLIIVNHLLNLLSLPNISFNYRDFKRISKNLDYKVDFQKEFVLSLYGMCLKSYYTAKHPEKIITVEEMRKIRNTTSSKIKPSWYWEDRIKYTFIKD